MTIDIGTYGLARLDQIIVEDRARQEMGDIEDLEESMKERGLNLPTVTLWTWTSVIPAQSNW